jgi:hypothetical protein
MCRYRLVIDIKRRLKDGLKLSNDGLTRRLDSMPLTHEAKTVMLRLYHAVDAPRLLQIAGPKVLQARSCRGWLVSIYRVKPRC